MTKQHQTVNITHKKKKAANQTIWLGPPSKRRAPKTPKIGIRSDTSDTTIEATIGTTTSTIIGRQRMTQRIKLNIAEKILPLKRKANHGKNTANV
ncbi:hypothetical protein HpHCM45_04780 [Helicobacter pylori]